MMGGSHRVGRSVHEHCRQPRQLLRSSGYQLEAVIEHLPVCGNEVNGDSEPTDCSIR